MASSNRASYPPPNATTRNRPDRRRRRTDGSCRELVWVTDLPEEQPRLAYVVPEPTSDSSVTADPETALIQWAATGARERIWRFQIVRSSATSTDNQRADHANSSAAANHSKDSIVDLSQDSDNDPPSPRRRRPHERAQADNTTIDLTQDSSSDERQCELIWNPQAGSKQRRPRHYTNTNNNQRNHVTNRRRKKPRQQPRLQGDDDDDDDDSIFCWSMGEPEPNATTATKTTTTPNMLTSHSTQPLPPPETSSLAKSTSSQAPPPPPPRQPQTACHSQRKAPSGSILPTTTFPPLPVAPLPHSTQRTSFDATGVARLPRGRMKDSPSVDESSDSESTVRKPAAKPTKRTGMRTIVSKEQTYQSSPSNSSHSTPRKPAAKTSLTATTNENTNHDTDVSSWEMDSPPTTPQHDNDQTNNDTSEDDLARGNHSPLRPHKATAALSRTPPRETTHNPHQQPPMQQQSEQPNDSAPSKHSSAKDIHHYQDATDLPVTLAAKQPPRTRNQIQPPCRRQPVESSCPGVAFFGQTSELRTIHKKYPKQAPDLGLLMWVKHGKTQYPAHIVVPSSDNNATSYDTSVLVEVQWKERCEREWVPRSDILEPICNDQDLGDIVRSLLKFEEGDDIVQRNHKSRSSKRIRSRLVSATHLKKEDEQQDEAQPSTAESKPSKRAVGVKVEDGVNFGSVETMVEAAARKPVKRGRPKKIRQEDGVRAISQRAGVSSCSDAPQPVKRRGRPTKKAAAAAVRNRENPGGSNALNNSTRPQFLSNLRRGAVNIGDKLWKISTDNQHVTNQGCRVVGESIFYGPKDGNGDRATTRLLQVEWLDTKVREYVPDIVLRMD